MIGFCLVLVSIFFSAFASIFLKMNSFFFSEKTNIFCFLLNPYIFFGLFCYAVSFFCYVFVLKYVPLVVVQPAITAGASAVTSIVAIFVFKESISFFNFLGLIFVFLGVFLLFLKSS